MTLFLGRPKGFLDVQLFYSYALHVHTLVPLVMMGHSHFPWALKEFCPVCFSVVPYMEPTFCFCFSVFLFFLGLFWTVDSDTTTLSKAFVIPSGNNKKIVKQEKLHKKRAKGLLLFYVTARLQEA